MKARFITLVAILAMVLPFSAAPVSAHHSYSRVPANFAAYEQMFRDAGYSKPMCWAAIHAVNVRGQELGYDMRLVQSQQCGPVAGGQHGWANYSTKTMTVNHDAIYNYYGTTSNRRAAMYHIASHEFYHLLAHYYCNGDKSCGFYAAAGSNVQPVDLAECLADYWSHVHHNTWASGASSYRNGCSHSSTYASSTWRVSYAT